MVALVKNPHITRIFSSNELAGQRPKDGARYGVISKAELTTEEAIKAQARMDASTHKDGKREANSDFTNSFTASGQIKLEQSVQNDSSIQASAEISSTTARSLERMGVFGRSGFVNPQIPNGDQPNTLAADYASKFPK